MTRYSVRAMVKDDAQGEWLVERYMMPGPQYSLVTTTPRKEAALKAVKPWRDDENAIGFYVQQSNHFPEKFEAELPVLLRVLARDGDTFDGEWLVVRKPGGSGAGPWGVWNADVNYVSDHEPAFEGIKTFDKKTEAKDHAKGIAVRQNRPGVIFYKGDGEPQKVKIWGSRFWKQLGDRLRGKSTSGFENALGDAADQL